MVPVATDSQAIRNWGPRSRPPAGATKAPRKAAWGRYSGGAGIPALAARPQLRAPEQASGRGHQGAPKKRPGATIRGGGIPAHAARPQLRATEQGAGGGHQGDPKKRPGAAIWGGRDTGPSALPDRNCGPRSSVPVNATKAPWKSGVWPLFGVRRTRASPAKSGASWRKISLVGCDGRKLCPKFSASGF